MERCCDPAGVELRLRRLNHGTVSALLLSPDSKCIPYSLSNPCCACRQSALHAAAGWRASSFAVNRKRCRVAVSPLASAKCPPFSSDAQRRQAQPALLHCNQQFGHVHQKRHCPISEFQAGSIDRNSRGAVSNVSLSSARWKDNQPRFGTELSRILLLRADGIFRELE